MCISFPPYNSNSENFPLGCKSKPRPQSDLGLGKNARPAKVMVLSVELWGGGAGGLKGVRGVAGLSSVHRTGHRPIRPQRSGRLHIRRRIHLFCTLKGTRGHITKGTKHEVGDIDKPGVSKTLCIAPNLKPQFAPIVRVLWVPLTELGLCLHLQVRSEPRTFLSAGHSAAV